MINEKALLRILQNIITEGECAVIETGYDEKKSSQESRDMLWKIAGASAVIDQILKGETTSDLNRTEVSE